MEKDRGRMTGRDIKSVYILLTDTGTLFTKMIKWYTNAPYNHVSIVFDRGLNEIYSFGRKYPRNPLIAGFIKENVYYGTYRYFSQTRCQLLKMTVSTEEYIRINNAVENFKNNQDVYSYNLLGLLGVVFRRPIHPKNKYFCSQFVAEVFRHSGMHIWNMPTALVTPNDFLEHPRFEVVYEGLLYDYPLIDKNVLSLFPLKEVL